MQPYNERAADLVEKSSVAVAVLLGDAPGDAEFIPVKPKKADAEMWTELRSRWHGRGLRSVGVIGLVDGAFPCCALKEPLDSQQISALAAAFHTYVQVLFQNHLAAQAEASEIAELEQISQLKDTRK